MKRWKNTSRARLWWMLALIGGGVGCTDARLRFTLASTNEQPVEPNAATSTGSTTLAPAPTALPGTEPTVPFDAASTEPPEAPASADAAGVPLDGALPPAGSETWPALDGTASTSNYVRLTHLQWENSVIDNLRLDAPTGYLETLTPDAANQRYTNNQEVLRVGDALLADYQAAAESIAERVATDATLLGEVSSAREPAAFIAEVGRRFYRRPLTAAEQATFLTLFDTGASLAEAGADSFAAGAQMLLQVWIQAPNFVYRVEHSDDLLSGYEVATRLALLLTDSTPSDALLDAAAAGELDTADGVESAAVALLATPRAESVWRRFHDETYGLGRLMTLEFDASLGLGTSLNADLVEVAHRFFDRQFRDQLGLRALLLSNVGYVSAGLAPLYDVDPPAVGEFDDVVFSTNRLGFFAQLPALMIDSVGETPNAFRRGGVFTRYVLCQPNVEPPPTTPLLPLPPESTITNREYSRRLVAEDDCQQCHQYMDPFGLAFENFDGLGRERSTDHGLPVDTSGTYPYADNVTFADSADLMRILAESPLAHRCYSQELTEFGLGRALGSTDEALVAELHARSLNDDESLTGLVIALVRSDTFRSAGGSQ